MKARLAKAPASDCRKAWLVGGIAACIVYNSVDGIVCALLPSSSFGCSFGACVGCIPGSYGSIPSYW